MVAPLAGAWIETAYTSAPSVSFTSRPSRARGLKHFDVDFLALDFIVAPLAGAWIETSPNPK